MSNFSEFANIGDGQPLPDGHGWQVLCEGCGLIIVDDEGTCISPDCLK